MKLPRRNFLHLAAGAAALPAVSRIARAQTYPSRPIRVIVPFAAGGQSDILARLIGQWLSERLGQPFVIENRPGAAANIGTEAVVRAPPDGYTLLLVSTTNAINATLYDKLNFNFIADRSYRQAQQGDQYRARRPEIQGAACRPRWRRAGALARRLWQAHRRGDREVGQGGEVHGHQSRLIRAPQPNIP